jgi:uncharacterized protein (TIGR02246 family)
MKMLHFLVPAAALVLSAACTTSGPSRPADPAKSTGVADTAATREIRDAGQARHKALEAGDTGQYLAAYSDNAVWMPPNSPNVIGKELAGMRLKALLDKFTIETITESEELNMVAPEWAIERGRYSLVLSAKEGAESQQEVGSYLTTWQKQSDGKWRIVYDIWNSTRPSAPMPAGN